MSEIKQFYQDENEFLKYLDVAVRAFKIYSQTSKEDMKKLTFADALLEAYVDFNIEKGSTKSYNSLYYSCKKELFKDKGYELRKYIKVLYSAIYRKTFSIISRENKELMDFNQVKNHPDYNTIVDNILKTDPNITQAERRAILSSDAENFLTYICNQVAHGNVHNIFINEKEKKETYLKIMDKYKAQFGNSLKKAIIEDDGLKKLFFKEEVLKINFYSFRLNKNFQFNLTRDNIMDLMSMMLNSVSYYKNNTVLDINSLEMINDYKKAINEADYFSIIEKNTTPQVAHFLKLYKDTKDDNYRQQALSLMHKDMFEDIQKQVAISKMETYIDHFKHVYKQWNNQFNVAVGKCAINHCVFNNSRRMDWLQEQLYGLSLLNSIYLHSPFFEDSEKYSLQELALNIYDFMRKEKEEEPQFVMNALYSSEKHNLYNEMLITQTLNILQLAEKKGLWEEIGRRSTSVANIANSYDFDERGNKSKEVYVVEKLRNSFQHVRFLKDNDSFQIFDGIDNENLNFQYEIFVDELEEVKKTALQVLTEHNNRKIKEQEDIESLEQDDEDNDEKE